MKNFTVYYQIRNGRKVLSYGEIYVVKARNHDEALRKFKELIQGAFVVEVKEGYYS